MVGNTIWFDSSSLRMIVYGIYFKENRVYDPGVGADEGLMWRHGLFQTSMAALDAIDRLIEEDKEALDEIKEKDSSYAMSRDVSYSVVGVEIKN